MIQDKVQEASDKTEKQREKAQGLLQVVRKALPIWWKAEIVADPKNYEIRVERRGWKYISLSALSGDPLILVSGFKVHPQYDETFPQTLTGMTLSPHDTTKEKAGMSYWMAKRFSERVERVHHGRYKITIENPER